MLENIPTILTRRKALWLGSAGVASLASLTNVGRALAACKASPSMTEGPFWVDEKLNRTDIRSDPETAVIQPGLPLRLMINVVNAADGCAPLSGVWVDIWHCSATGVYSDERAGMGNPDTRGQKYLRGYQVTDAHGNARFLTVYPGWYRGRTVHIHVRVRKFVGTTATFNFTSQLFFDDAFSTAIFSRTVPYSSRKNRSMFNNDDNIYARGGSQMLMHMAEDSTHAQASINMAVNLTSKTMRIGSHEFENETDHAHDFGGGISRRAFV